jgi:leucyl aminopeptidase (aminopeptidase T)
MGSLTRLELRRLVQRVFAPREVDLRLALLVDLPDAGVADEPAWRARRALAASWARELAASEPELGLPTDLFVYRNVRMNNADLPDHAWPCAPDAMPEVAERLELARAVTFEEIFATHGIFLAPTQFSATAPLKLAARRHGFRAATMPGFSEAMMPALRLDYAEVNRRVLLLKGLLDDASLAKVRFEVDGTVHDLELDLRFRKGHASGGVLVDSGVAGNLPSGEAYIVPYEGERPGEPSRSAGRMPVQLEGEVVVYEIEGNRAVRVSPGGPVAAAEAALLAREPAYGNLAELGLGVLSDLGIAACGDVLLDEKLGLHIAFGRSDHFGGQVGAAQFSRPDAVVHIDRVYVKDVQPRVKVARLDLTLDDGTRVPLMRDGRYVIDFSRLAKG